MRLLPSSLSGRLIFGATMFTLIVLAATLVMMDRVLERFVTGQIDQRLDNKLVALASQLRVATDGTITLEGDANGPPFDAPHHQSFWQVTGPHNTIESRWLAQGAFVPPNVAEIEAAPGPPPPGIEKIGPHGGFASRPRTLRLRGPDQVTMHMRVALRDYGAMPVIFLAAAPLRAIADPMREAMSTIATAIIVLGVASLLGVLGLGRVVLRPLARLRQDVAMVRTGRLTVLPSAQPSEVRPLVDELNSLLAQNAVNLARARKHVANLAHGLKTPLATLSLGVARLESGNNQLSPLVEMIERRVRHHLGRARAAALDGPVRSQTNVSARLVDIVVALKKIHADRRIVVSVDCASGLAVACEPQDVDEILGNLLENAFKYAGSRVTCAVREVAADIRFEIADDGPGLTADEIVRVLRPGERLDEEVPGFGFGLPIAQELVELYGGTLALEPGNEGLLVRLTLPRGGQD